MTAQEQEELMIRKLRQCSVPFDFMDPMAELKGKEIKRDTLNELVDYVSTSRGVLTENMYPEIIKMVCKFIFCVHKIVAICFLLVIAIFFIVYICKCIVMFFLINILLICVTLLKVLNSNTNYFGIQFETNSSLVMPRYFNNKQKNNI